MISYCVIKSLGEGYERIMIKLRDYKINPALIVIDVQNGFVSKGGFYDLLGMDTSQYERIIPRIQDLITKCRNARYTSFLYSSRQRVFWD